MNLPPGILTACLLALAVLRTKPKEYLVYFEAPAFRNFSVIQLIQSKI